MELDQILKAISIGETHDWEFKSGKGGFPENFWFTYSGMGNTDGGTVVLGIKESKQQFTIEGLTPEQIHSFQKKLWDDLNNRSKTSCNLLSPHHVHAETINGKSLLVIDIPKAGRTKGPVYLGLSPFGNTYRRCHEGDYKCSDDQVRRMLADSSSLPPDHRILKGFTIDDLDPLSLDQYRQRFLSAKPNHPWLSLPLLQFLEMLGGWRKDRESSDEGFTLAGLLMFGKHRPILDGCATYFVDYREKLDENVRWNHRIYPDGSWEPNLFQFYQKIWPHLSADLKVPFHLKGIQRVDETPIHTALREALVNALIHSDYNAPGGVIIERYSDRFILDNPGTLLVSSDQLRHGGISECRNKTLQTMFMLIGGGEKAGSGVHKIQSEWKNQHWRAPAYSFQDHPDRVKLVLPMISLIPETTLSSLQNRLGSRFPNLNPLEVLALVTAEIEEGVSNARLQELTSDHPTAITQTLQGLCAERMLISDNKRRWSRYKIPDSPHLAPVSPHLSSDSPHLSSDSPHLSSDSPHLSSDSPHFAALEQIALPITRVKKASKTQIREIILLLCQKRSLSLNTLAKLLNRDPKSLQNHYLTALVREGLLKLQYPDRPNRPDQTYFSP